MGTSNGIFSLSDVQGDSDFISYAKELDSYKIPTTDYKEPDARNPTLNEIYRALAESEIEILNERQEKGVDDEGKDLTIHIFDITDNEIDYSEDLTIKYKTGQSTNDPILSISGIKTHYRILIKLTTQLTELCGSFFILNPYEALFIQKGMTYNQIWSEITKKSSEKKYKT